LAVAVANGLAKGDTMDDRERLTPEVYWQFSNGKIAKLDEYSTNMPVSTYTVWDRSLGGYVIYAKA